MLKVQVSPTFSSWQPFSFRRVWSCLVLVCSTSYTLHIQAPSREKQTLFAWCSEQSGLRGISRFCCWSSGNVESPVKDMRHWFMILHGPKPMAETLWPCFDRSLSTARSDNSVKQRCAVSTRQAKRAGADSFNASRFEDFLECFFLTQYSVWMIIIYGEYRIPIDELFWGFPNFPIDFGSAICVNVLSSVGTERGEFLTPAKTSFSSKLDRTPFWLGHTI